MIPFHILVGAIGAFVLCPIAVFSRKGSPLHITAGKSFLIISILIALSGALLLVDPLFLLVYWPEQGLIHDFGQYFKSSHYPELFFFYLNMTFIYFCFSAARVWSRVGHGTYETIRTNWFDWTLTIVTAIFILFFFIIGIVDLIHADKLGVEFIAGSIIVISFIIIDLYTFIFPVKVSGKPWWVLHMTKMFVAWSGLLSAFWLRIRVHVIPHDYLDIHYHTGTILWLTLTLIGYLLYKNRFKNNNPSLSAN